MMTISTTLWSCIPMPISSTVTTQQIVRMMKRGENGVISVSMGPLGQCVAVLFFSAQSTPLVLMVRQNDDRCYAAQFLSQRSKASMAVRAQLVGNPTLLEPALRQPGVGGLDRPRDMIVGSREVIGRANQRA